MVVPKLTTMTCSVEVKTYTTATTSTTNWFTESITLDIDGGASSIHVGWESFISHGHLESHG